MAIYHLNVKGISPARGESIITAANSQSGQALRSYRSGRLHRKSNGTTFIQSGIELPATAPHLDREELWNLAEAAWPGGTSIVAKRFTLALPRELPTSMQVSAVREFCNLFPTRARDWSIRDDGDGNPHALILVSSYDLTDSGFVKPPSQSKTRFYACRDINGKEVNVRTGDWKAAKANGTEKIYNFKDGKKRTMSEAKAEGLSTADRTSKAPVSFTITQDGITAYAAEVAALKRIRASWAEIANRLLAAHALETDAPFEPIDHRTYKDRGMDRVPMLHEGNRPLDWVIKANKERRELNAAIMTTEKPGA